MTLLSRLKGLLDPYCCYVFMSYSGFAHELWHWLFMSRVYLTVDFVESVRLLLVKKKMLAMSNEQVNLCLKLDAYESYMPFNSPKDSLWSFLMNKHYVTIIMFTLLLTKSLFPYKKHFLPHKTLAELLSMVNSALFTSVFTILQTSSFSCISWTHYSHLSDSKLFRSSSSLKLRDVYTG